ncbi:MAG TPA: anthranilate phosphoribosyltransferase [Marinobacter hydrocarbonoclasticus]|jgi:anthranilate phosphoribosyltransferase|uniref:anthranilate phosphoribosyltransferase n=1 Tax=Marinobacter TaxID=2742 RepID=UPI000C5DC97F|nr:MULTISPECIES: anthranilate phosphoribosyltransferase [Marinobacter]MAL32384.1 anthranilate phosphoribosyltransferase [Marinobacter sp.]MBH92573.1 anthranilate phosphoribosyltransferase [Marinobacter sp.]HAX09475.1 anthranilate phosphoribosyltransferase [Marinobacter nauticus]HCL37616.1 anthranilate phosphoribosyltransferase [Marinobacter nauticus]HCR46631.1 anthranilate phosphoribosyltransferase [Marinobacter nauticus]|tara:strand:- start:91 stop:1119 length:1029 start_codon:yes stop_codon:yes gene_type:complete
MDMKQALNRIASNLDLSRDEMKDVMRIVMNGEATDAQIGAFLMGLRLKSETIDEITGATEVMRELATKVSINASPLVDIVGTGGDGANLFNVSSASSFVVAAAGGFVAKHGNRGVSSKSGSADLIEKAGINLDMKPEEVARCVEQIGVGFMFAPAHHGAMKHAIGPRRELGCRTIFNILGPMTNPAGVTRQLIGVFTRELCRPMAEVMQRLGAEHIMVVCSKDGLDEISLATVTHVAELKDGEITEYDLTPEDLGIKSQSLVGLTVNSSDESLKLIKAAFGRNHDETTEKARDMIALNAGAAIYVAGLAKTAKEGVDMALDAMGSGLAAGKMSELADFSQCF